MVVELGLEAKRRDLFGCKLLRPLLWASLAVPGVSNDCEKVFASRRHGPGFIPEVGRSEADEGTVWP